MAATLWASPADRQRIAQARSAVILVGSYDGSGNYGDVLQFATVLETVRQLPGAPLPIAIVERETLAHHEALLGRHGAQLSGPAYAHFQADDGAGFEDSLVQLAPGLGPARSALYMYGGGYLNGWWGARKVAHTEAAESLAGHRRLPVVASGLQVEDAAVAAGGVGHELLARASWIGLRDIRSLEYVRAQIPATDGKAAELTGDDAIPVLRPGEGMAEAVVNLHLNDGGWVSEDPDSRNARVVAGLREVGRMAGTSLELQPVVAYEDPRISESRVLSALFERHGAELRASGLAPTEPLDVLADATDNGLGRFRRARLTVCCSYHIALTSLLAGIPTLLLAENAYYDQKAAGLRNLFGLDRNLVGVPGTLEDATRAAAVFADGPARTALVEQMRIAGEGVFQKHARGRAAVSASLSAALQPQ